MSLIKIAVTPPEPAADEAERLRAILAAGWEIHLRYPSLTMRPVRDIIEAIPQEWHRRLHLHGHFGLAAEFNLGGLHLNSRCPEPPAFYDGPLSITCHTPSELLRAAQNPAIAYATFSPVFDSVSKTGYAPSLSPQEIARAVAAAGKLPVIALGGVAPDRVAEVRDAGFAGYAVLGALANTATGRLGDVLQQFQKQEK